VKKSLTEIFKYIDNVFLRQVIERYCVVHIVSRCRFLRNTQHGKLPITYKLAIINQFNILVISLNNFSNLFFHSGLMSIKSLPSE